ncbi:Uncharacterised protein [Candidatus Bilamarchaeum dharawalense]|uniref:Uncharacterized protein n=1 Tax=Candidatus Bilamarchaeum dharawalense TaxID=2885759 RepID=A0A5E4LRF9_9ARCH|nr:Uncharacterised protein [Candidatus Bilamarchaeum dharawalense]
MIFRAIAKLHFIIGLGMFLFIGLMVVSDSMTARALLLLPIVLTFMASKILHSIDQANEVENMMYRYRKRMDANNSFSEPSLPSGVLSDGTKEIPS